MDPIQRHASVKQLGRSRRTSVMCRVDCRVPEPAKHLSWLVCAEAGGQVKDGWDLHIPPSKPEPDTLHLGVRSGLVRER